MHISHVELRNFRRLAATRIDFAARTTLFVGANNSGKTSAMTALRMFLAKKGNFCLNDLPVSLWRRIDEIGKKLEITPDTESIETDWRSILPSLDVWVRFETNELHRVSHLLPTLDWSGEPIGVRLQLEPTSNDDFHKRYREARKASANTIVAAKAAADEERKGSEEYTVSLWPASMCEFLERRLGSNFSVKAYLLDPALIVPPQNGVAKPQEVPTCLGSCLASVPASSHPPSSILRPRPHPHPSRSAWAARVGFSRFPLAWQRTGLRPATSFPFMRTGFAIGRGIRRWTGPRAGACHLTFSRFLHFPLLGHLLPLVERGLEDGRDGPLFPRRDGGDELRDDLGPFSGEVSGLAGIVA